MRLIIKLISGLLTFILALFVSMYFIFSTSEGTRILLTEITKFVPGKFSIGKIEGNLQSTINLTNIRLLNDDVSVSIKSLRFAFNPLQLINKRIVFYQLDSDEIQVDLKTASDTKRKSRTFDPTTLFATLKYIKIDHLDIKHARLTQQNKIIYQLDRLLIEKKPSAPYTIMLTSPMGKVTGNVYLNWSPSFTWNIHLNANQIMLNSLLQNERSRFDFDLTSDGSWDAKTNRINLKMDRVKGELRGYPLQGFAALHYNNGILRIEDSYLAIADSHAKVIGSIDKIWNLNWKLDIPQISKIVPNCSGEIAASGSMKGPENNIQIEAKVKANHLSSSNVKINELSGEFLSHIASQTARLTLSTKNIDINHYLIPKLDILQTSQWKNRHLTSEINVSSNGMGQIQGRVQLPIQNFSSIDSQTIRGEFKVNYPELNKLLAEIPEIKHPNGQLQGKIALSGYLLHPFISMNMTIQNGQFDIPKLGTTLHNITLNSTYDSKHSIHLMGSFNAGKGNGKLNALIDINQEGFPSTLTFEGENLQLMNLKEYKIDITPLLKVAFDKNKIEVRGRILVPYAKITPTDFSNVVTLPDEVEFVDQKKSEPVLPTNLMMNIRITLGEYAYLSYANLTTTLGGSVRITQTQGKPPTAMGELNIIKGKYHAYGNFLKIKEGHLIYNGNPLTNPGLDIRAFKHVKTISVEGQSQFLNSNQLSSVYTGSSSIEVGVWLRGTLDKPKVMLYSNPAGTDQRDILSYLVFGYPQSQISSKSSLALLNDLTTGDGKGVTTKVQDFLGLSELNIGSTEYYDPDHDSTGNTTSVSIGKKISKHFSVHYTYGFFHPIHILSLKYLMNKHLSLQSEASTIETGADIMYEFERD